MRAYCARIAPATSARDPLTSVPKPPGSSTSLEEPVALTEPSYFDQDTQQVDLTDPQSAAVAAAGSSMVTEPAVPEIPQGEFPLDYNSALRDTWAEYVMRSRRMLDDKKWTEAFKKLLWAESQGRPVMFQGAQVASYTRDGNFTKSKFEAEQPELAAEFTRYVTEMALDVEALRARYPKVYEAYRAPTLRLKNEPVVPR